MEIPKRRMGAAKLRTSDAMTLQVLTQELLRRPLGQVEPSTVLDLLALSEIGDQLPASLARELEAYRLQILREISDLPDGPPLLELLRELQPLNPENVPACLRAHLRLLATQRKQDDVVPALEALIARWEEVPAEPITLPVASVAPRITQASSVGSSARASAARGTGSSTAKVAAAKPATRPRARAASTPAAQIDPRRAEWIEEDAISRLANYGASGIKESVLVGGAVHRSPYDDMTTAEVLTTLRKMKREGKINNSAGRWSRR